MLKLPFTPKNIQAPIFCLIPGPKWQLFTPGGLSPKGKSVINYFKNVQKKLIKIKYYIMLVPIYYYQSSPIYSHQYMGNGAKTIAPPAIY